jgi:hypothetical protein
MVEQPSYQGIKRPNVDELETLSKSRGRELRGDLPVEITGQIQLRLRIGFNLIRA